MPRGGARVNSGPPPDPNALRRDRPSDKDGWRTLPGPRTEPAPPWPLQPDIKRRALKATSEAELANIEDQLPNAISRQKTALAKKASQLRREITALDFELEAQGTAETELWAELWRSPQAHAWAELGWYRDVAQYVRHKVLGEMGSLDDAKEARQWSDRLGLNPAAMLRNRWRVGGAGPTERPTPAKKSPAKRSSARDRLRVVRGSDEA